MKAKFVNEAMGDVLKGKSDEEIMSSLESGDLDSDDLLIKSSGRGFLFGVKKAVEMGANVHADDDLALRRASGNGHIDVVEFLLKNGANVHGGSGASLRLASQRGHTDIAELLKKYM